MSGWIAPVAALLLLVSSMPSVGATTRSGRGQVGRTADPVAGQYIVTLRDVAAPDVAAVAGDLAGRHGGTALKVYRSALRGFAVKMTDAQALALSTEPRVASVTQDGYVHASATESPAPWGVDRIDQRDLPLDNSYTTSQSGASVHAYIADTGIRATHVEFGGRAAVGVDEIGDGRNGADCNGHGTHVAGTVGGATVGVAKSVSIVAVRVLDCLGNGTDSQVLAGIDWINAHAIKPAVVNMSLGGSLDPPLDTAIQNSIASGLTYVVAAGNSGIDACSTSPADVAQAITVGATDQNDARASFSNTGSCVKLFAPGVSILSSWYTSDTAGAIASGTSMAAPHVAGAAALYLETHPTASPAQVSAAILASATVGHVTNAGAGSPNLLEYVGPQAGPHPGEVITAVGAARTERLLDTVLTGGGEFDIHAVQTPNRLVAADASCGAVTYGSTGGAGVVTPPAGADAGRDALWAAAAGTYPDATTGSGRGCVDIARSDRGPRAVGPAGDLAGFEYFGFGIDTVTWASTSLRAPPALTAAQLQGIYQCTYTDWSQVGGAAGPIQRILPPDGSGVLGAFLSGVLGVAGVSALPVSTGTCPAIERVGEDQGYDLLHGSHVYGPAGVPAHYEQAILPYSAGIWSFQSNHDTNPTIDLRAGVRPGALIVSQGSASVAASAVSWNGSSWGLNAATVVGNPGQVHVVAGVTFTALPTTATTASGTFGAGDVGKTVDGPRVYPGTRIVAVSPDGATATISPGARSSGPGDAAIGYSVASEGTIAATSGATGPFPGTHYLYDVIDHGAPSYAAVLAIVGFADSPGGVQSPLCNGGHATEILDAGFLPLDPRTSSGGNAGITCVKQTPT